MIVHVIRTDNSAFTAKVWVLADGTNRMESAPSESKKAVLKRWHEKYGKIEKIIEYDESMPRSAMAMTLADLQPDKPPKTSSPNAGALPANHVTETPATRDGPLSRFLNKDVKPTPQLNLRGLLDTMQALKRFEAMCLQDFMKFTPEQVHTFNACIAVIRIDKLNALADAIYKQPDDWLNNVNAIGL